MSQSAFEAARRVVSTYSDKMTNESIRNILVNWSDTDIGIRHPDLPVGVVARDQGSFDLYAGQTRLIGGLEGGLYAISGKIGLKAPIISLKTSGPESLYLAGKNIVKEAHDGAQFLSLLPTAIAMWDSILVRVNVGGNAVDMPMSSFFSKLAIFETPAAYSEDTVGNDFLSRI